VESPKKVRIAIVGATGYTGGELLRLVHGHPGIELGMVAGHGKAGQAIASVLPNFRGVLGEQVNVAHADQIASNAEAAFCALPHGASAPVVKALRARNLVVFDLSADFRLRDLDTYREWYGEHAAEDLIAQAVYGLCEVEREALLRANLIAVPGCYPTASALAILPLVHATAIDLDSIIVDAKSGASGAGKGLSEATHFSGLSEGLRAYKVGGLHRHTPEIEQTLSRVAKRPVKVTFTPHLVPMTRGILATVYAHIREGLTRDRATELARSFFAGSPSVTVLDPGIDPDTLWVRGSNRCFISYTVDERTGRVIAQAVIDNLVKGAAGQALQCFNLRFGFREDLGLEAVGMYP
jgi:N-acetyl-gamma-glutamyl-phosphate reductase